MGRFFVYHLVFYSFLLSAMDNQIEVQNNSEKTLRVNFFEPVPLSIFNNYINRRLHNIEQALTKKAKMIPNLIPLFEGFDAKLAQDIFKKENISVKDFTSIDYDLGEIEKKIFVIRGKKLSYPFKENPLANRQSRKKRSPISPSSSPHKEINHSATITSIKTIIVKNETIVKNNNAVNNTAPLYENNTDTAVINNNPPIAIVETKKALSDESNQAVEKDQRDIPKMPFIGGGLGFIGIFAILVYCMESKRDVMNNDSRNVIKDVMRIMHMLYNKVMVAWRNNEPI